MDDPEDIEEFVYDEEVSNKAPPPSKNSKFIRDVERANEALHYAITYIDISQLIFHMEINLDAMLTELQVVLGFTKCHGFTVTVWYKDGYQKAPTFKTEGADVISSRLTNIMEAVPWAPTADFIVELHRTLTYQVVNAGNYCIICNKQHPIDGLKPVVCSDYFCYWRFAELGLYADPVREVMTNHEVVDLLVTIAFAILKTPTRRDGVMEPFPPSFCMPDGIKEYDKMLSVLSMLPSIPDMLACGNIDKMLDEIHPELSYLLRWIIFSNRTYIKLGKTEELPDELRAHKPRFCFHIVSNPPEVQEQFGTAKEIYGVKTTYHGSALHNWYSILRNGLKNYSHTPLMTHAAVYGKGIYMSPEPIVAMHYTSAGSAWDKSMLSKHFRCLLVCEVIDHDVSINRAGSIWVAKNEDYVSAKYLAVF